HGEPIACDHHEEGRTGTRSTLIPRRRTGPRGCALRVDDRFVRASDTPGSKRISGDARAQPYARTSSTHVAAPSDRLRRPAWRTGGLWFSRPDPRRRVRASVGTPRVTAAARLDPH